MQQPQSESCMNEACMTFLCFWDKIQGNIQGFADIKVLLIFILCVIVPNFEIFRRLAKIAYYLWVLHTSIKEFWWRDYAQRGTRSLGNEELTSVIILESLCTLLSLRPPWTAPLTKPKPLHTNHTIRTTQKPYHCRDNLLYSRKSKI